jgi:hypothetical protein
MTCSPMGMGMTHLPCGIVQSIGVCGTCSNNPNRSNLKSACKGIDITLKCPRLYRYSPNQWATLTPFVLVLVLRENRTRTFDIFIIKGPKFFVEWVCIKQANFFTENYNFPSVIYSIFLYYFVFI